MYASILSHDVNHQTATADLFESLAASLKQLVHASDISGQDVVFLASAAQMDGAISQTAAELMFVVEGNTATKCPEWSVFFRDVITSYVIWDLCPAGVVNGVQAEWLVAQVDRAGTKGALALLSHVVAEADRVPLWLPAVIKGRHAKTLASPFVDAKVLAARPVDFAA